MIWKELVAWIVVGGLLLGFIGAIGYYEGRESYSKDDKAGEIIYFYKLTGERYKALYQSQCAQTEYANKKWWRANEMIVRLTIDNYNLKDERQYIQRHTPSGSK